MKQSLPTTDEENHPPTVFCIPFYSWLQIPTNNSRRFKNPFGRDYTQRIACSKKIRKNKNLFRQDITRGAFSSRRACKNKDLFRQKHYKRKNRPPLFISL